MLPLIRALGLKVDLEMLTDNFYRVEISPEESAYFINLQGCLYCIQFSTSETGINRKTFYVQNFEDIPTQTLVNMYQSLLEETPWVLQ